MNKKTPVSFLLALLVSVLCTPITLINCQDEPKNSVANKVEDVSSGGDEEAKKSGEVSPGEEDLSSDDEDVPDQIRDDEESETDDDGEEDWDDEGDGDENESKSDDGEEDWDSEGDGDDGEEEWDDDLSFDDSDLSFDDDSLTYDGDSTSQDDLSNISLDDETDTAMKQDLTMRFSFDLPLPLFGPTSLDGTFNMDTGAYTLGKTYSTKHLGPIAIKDLKIELSSEKGLDAHAEVDIYGFNADLDLNYVKFTDDGPDAEFELTIKQIPDIYITPWKSFNIDSWYLHLTSTTKEIYTLISIETEHDTKLAINLGDEPSLTLSSHKIKASDLLPFIKGTPFDTIAFHDVRMKIGNPFKKGELKTYTMKTWLDIAHLNLGLDIDMSHLDSLAKMTSKKDFTLTATLPTLSIADVVTLKTPTMIISNQVPSVDEVQPLDKSTTLTLQEARFIPKQFRIQRGQKAITHKEGQTYLTLRGLATVKLPVGLGTITAPIIADFDKDRFILSMKIEKDISHSGISFDNPYLYMSTEGLVEIVGEAKIGKLDIYVHLQVKKSKTKGKPIVTLYGTLKDDKPIKPFEKAPGINKVPVLKDISIKDVTLGFGSDKSIYFEGTTTILGMTLKTKLKKTPDAASIWCEAPPDFEMSKIIPGTNISIMEQITFKRLWIVASSSDYFDSDHGVNVKAGFSVVADVEITKGAVAKIFGFMKVGEGTMKLTVNKGESEKDVFISIIVPTEVEFNSKLKMENIAVEISPEPLSIGGLILFLFSPSSHNKDLRLTGMIEYVTTPPQATLSGTMQGEWKNPFGISGFTIANCAIEVGAFLATEPITPILGITGELDVGPYKMSMAYKFSPDFSQTILMGSINELSTHDLVSLVNNAGGKIPKQLVPKLAIKDVEFIFAPAGGSIGEIVFAPGLTAKGKLNMLNYWAMIEFNLDSTSIIGKGAMDEIDLGPIKVTGPGLPGKTKKGPVIDIELTYEKQGIFISGQADIFGIDAEITIDVGLTSVKLSGTGKVLGAYEVDLNAVSTKTADGKADFVVTGKFENNFMNYIQNQVDSAIDGVQKELQGAFMTAYKKLKKIHNAVDAIDTQIRTKENQIGQLKDVIAAKNAAAKGDVRAAASKVGDAKQKVTNLENEIHEKTVHLNRLKSMIALNESEHDPQLDKLIDRFATHYKPAVLALNSSEQDLVWARERVKDELFKQSIFTHEQFLSACRQRPKLYANIFKKAFDGATHAVAKGASAVKDGVTKVYNGTTWVIQKGTTQIKHGVTLVYNGTRWLTKQAYDAAKRTAQKALYAAEFGPEITLLTAQIAALKTAELTAQGALQAVETSLQGVSNLAFDPTTSKEAAKIAALGVEIGMLENSKIPLIATQKTAKLTLKAVEIGALSVTEAVKLATSLLEDVATIKEVTARGSAQEFLHGKLPTLTVEVSVFGATKTLTFSFDAKDVGGTIASVVKAILMIVKP